MFGNLFGRFFAGKRAEKVDSAKEGLDGDEALEHLRPLLERVYGRVGRTAFRPVTEPGSRDGSKGWFNGGPAWIEPDGVWPACNHCGKPLELFAHIDLGAVPDDFAGRFGSGFLQLFYCTEADCASENGWEAFDETMKLVRIVQPDNGGREHENPHNASTPVFVKSWEPITDYPGDQETEAPGVEWDGPYQGPQTMVVETENIRSEPVTWAAYEAAFDLIGPAPGEKLGGWPYWVQGAEYPSCPECGERMELLLQVDSEDNIDYMFGDMGVGHVTQCPTHKHVVAFGWACS